MPCFLPCPSDPVLPTLDSSHMFLTMSCPRGLLPSSHSELPEVSTRTQLIPLAPFSQEDWHRLLTARKTGTVSFGLGLCLFPALLNLPCCLLSTLDAQTL